MNPPFERILITGAAGKLGSQLRRGLAPLARKVRLTDIAALKDPEPHEEIVACDLSDLTAVLAASQGVDAIVHFGGAGLEAPWETILSANIVGSYNVFEAARRQGVRRIIYASSVHAIGFHEVEAHIDANSPHRPDSLYGVAKCFVEDLGRLYWDKFGLESVHLRIFSSYPEPVERRMLWSWLSYEDCIRLVSASLTTARVGHTIAFGMSDNKLKPVDNKLSSHLAFYPQDSAEPFRAAVEAARPPLDAKAPSTRYLGGWFVDLGHPDDEVKL
jgi:uronate dehydrogenase